MAASYIKLATPELIALDLLGYTGHAGGLNHIATALSELIEILDPMTLIQLAIDTQLECQLQRIGYILDHIDVIEEEKVRIMIDALARYIQDNQPSYLPLASEITKVGCPRCKKWRIVENTEIESDK